MFFHQYRVQYCILDFRFWICLDFIKFKYIIYTMKKRILSVIFLTAILLSGCKLTDWFGNIVDNMQSDKRTTKVITLQTSHGDVKLTVEVVDTENERERGLMNREKLEESKGMWFVFLEEAERRFWMKNTLIPLDVIFFNKEKRAVHIVENMEPCKNPQCITYPSESQAMYALEVRGGFVKAYAVKVGDKVVEEK